MRPLLAATTLAAVLVGGFIYGALSHLTAGPTGEVPPHHRAGRRTRNRRRPRHHLGDQMEVTAALGIYATVAAMLGLTAWLLWGDR